MVELYVEHIYLIPWVLAIAAAVVQFFCCKAKRRIVRLIPVLVLLVAGVVFTVLMVLAEGWNFLGYLLLLSYVLWMLAACVPVLIGMAIRRRIKARKK